MEPESFNEASLYPEFSDGIAMVVGGSGGIGAAISTTLARLGSNVAITYRSRKSNADETVDKVRASGRSVELLQLDIEDAEATKAAVDGLVLKYGRLHSVVYAAGPSLEFLYINEIEPSEWARVINGDVNGCFNLISAVLPHLRAQKGGSFVALTTAAADRSPPRDILSAAPKAAIQMLVRGVAREEGRSGIRANCVGPGYTAAGLGLTTVHDHTADYVERMVKAIPLRRAGQAQDVANVVAFLLSDRASYVTGVSIPVSGGLHLS